MFAQAATSAQRNCGGGLRRSSASPGIATDLIETIVERDQEVAAHETRFSSGSEADLPARTSRSRDHRRARGGEVAQRIVTTAVKAHASSASAMRPLRSASAARCCQIGRLRRQSPARNNRAMLSQFGSRRFPSRESYGYSSILRALACSEGIVLRTARRWRKRCESMADARIGGVLTVGAVTVDLVKAGPGDIAAFADVAQTLFGQAPRRSDIWPARSMSRAAASQ